MHTLGFSSTDKTNTDRNIFTSQIYFLDQAEYFFIYIHIYIYVYIYKEKILNVANESIFLSDDQIFELETNRFFAFCAYQNI